MGCTRFFLIFFALPYGRITQNRTTVIANSPVGSTAWTTLLVVNADSCQAGYGRDPDQEQGQQRLLPEVTARAKESKVTTGGGKLKI